MKYIIAIVMIVAIVAVITCEFIRVTRIIIAYFKGDENTIDRLTHSYADCERIAAINYDCSKELFAQYWKEVKEFNPRALPWDALDFCAYEYDLLNNKGLSTILAPLPQHSRQWAGW